jgi:IclR family transcriptional regulator, acetate operon repressor
MDTPYTLQTVERAIAFLEYIASASEPPAIRDISKALDLNITTCYHLLRTLMALNYIKRNDDGGLELGDGVGVLVRGYRRADSPEKFLSDIVKRLEAETLETSFLSLREDNSVTLKVLFEGSQKLRVAGLHVGLKGREHRRAAGKAVLAHLDVAARTRILDESLAQMPDRQRKATLKSLEKELPLIEARGWATDDGQIEQDIVAIAAPIFDASGSVLGALGIVTPVFRMDKSRDMFLDSVMTAAAEASQLLKSAGAS